MAILKDEEEQQGQGISQSLGQGMAAQPDQQQAVQQQPSQEPTTLSSSAPGMLGETARTPQAQKPQQKQQRAGTGTFTNIRSYLQAAQGGGQQRVAQAAQQQVQRLGTGAQKGVEQAQEAFRGRLGAGSGAIFQGAEPGKFLNEEKAAKQATTRAGEILEAARGTTYQAPQVQTQSTEEGSTQPPTPPQQYFKPEDLEAFSNIINAQYQGPASLQQAGLYEQAAEKARAAEQTGRLTETAAGRQQLLRDIFGRSREYGRGASKLDALLLNTSRENIRQLQEQATPAIQSIEALQQAQNLSANEALQRRQAIEQIKSEAREEFGRQQEEELTQTEKRIAGAKEQAGELRDYFADILQDAQNKPVDLSATEAALLGIEAGEGFYNLTPDQLLSLQDLRKERLISKDERARLEALSQLAGLASDRGISREFFTPYEDASLAGTQSVLSALNQEDIRSKLNAEERAFLDAMNRNVTGYGTGSASYSRGLFRGRGNVTESAQFSQNLSDLLSRAGYNITPEDREVMSSPEVLQAIMESAQQGGSEQEILARAYSLTQQAPTSEGVTSPLTEGGVVAPQELDLEGMARTAGEASLAQAGAAGLAGLGATGFGAASTASAGPYYLLAKLATDPGFRDQLSGLTTQLLGKEAGKFGEGVLGTVDAGAAILDAVGAMASLGGVRGFGTNLFGSSKSGARGEAQQRAREAAAADLRSRIKSELGGAGFERRAAVLSKDVAEQDLANIQTEQATVGEELQTKQNQLREAQQAQQKYGSIRNVDNQIKSLERARESYRFSPAARNQIDAQLNEYRNARDLLNLDTKKLSKDVTDLSKKATDLSGKLAQQQSLVERASAVQERNVGLMELLKRLDRTNV